MTQHHAQAQQIPDRPQGAGQVFQVSTSPRLDTAGIAALLGLSREHVTDRITKRVDFPKPFINVSRRTRFWRTKDVLEWMRGGK